MYTQEENEKRRQSRRMRLLKAKVMVMAKQLRENRMAETYSQTADADSKEVGTIATKGFGGVL